MVAALVSLASGRCGRRQRSVRSGVRPPV